MRPEDKPVDLGLYGFHFENAQMRPPRNAFTLLFSPSIRLRFHKYAGMDVPLCETASG